MKKFLKIIFLVSLLLTNFLSFSQGSDDNTGGGNLDGADPAAVPINSKLIYLLIAAVLFAFYSIKGHNKKQNIR